MKELAEELRLRAEHVESFFDHILAARVMRRAADALEKLSKEEVPTDRVAMVGEEQ